MIDANAGLIALAGAERRRSREKFLLEERWIPSESFVYNLTCGRSRPLGQGSHGMTRYLISFDAHAMDHIPDEDMRAVAKPNLSRCRSVDSGVDLRGCAGRGVWLLAT